MKAKVLSTGKIISIKKNEELDSRLWVNSNTGEKYYDDELEICDSKEEIQNYLDSLDKDDILSIIKYGLRGSNVPEGVTVEDIYEVIGCIYIGEKM